MSDWQVRLGDVVRFFVINGLLFVSACWTVALVEAMVGLLPIPPGHEGRPIVDSLPGVVFAWGAYLATLGAIPAIVTGIALFSLAPRRPLGRRRPLAIGLSLLAMPVGWLMLVGLLLGATYIDGYGLPTWLAILTPIGLLFGVVARLPRSPPSST